ncbi:MAG TPA: M1 family metallopeptidase [Vicinamibacterales bacterium]|nr:M1 family metallopeptidase [Vicinamibacterales bacterium]
MRLDQATRTVRGRERIVWRNISNQSTRELQFHLYWNAFRDPSSTWLTEARLLARPVVLGRTGAGSIDVTAVRLVDAAGAAHDITGTMEFISPDDGSRTDRTVMRVPIPDTAPQVMATVEVEWTAKVPKGLARTGYIGDYYFFGQWFPKLGVIEDAGWNTHQFHYATEFYADYGVYDVGITVPQRFVVGASGDERGFTPNGDGTTTYRFHGEDIHDFAWAASPDFVEYRQVFSSGSLPHVNMRLLLLREHTGQQEAYFASTVAALEYYGLWFGPYPYSTLTIIDPAYKSGTDGMEYPTLYSGGTRWLTPTPTPLVNRAAVHEAGHQFWYGIVGSNEFEHGWMDEGINTYSTARAIAAGLPDDHLVRRFFGDLVPWQFDDIPLRRETDNNRLPAYRDDPEADLPSMPTYRYSPRTARLTTYNKTALWLNTLENYLGWIKMQRVMSTYFERWKFRHPQPEDFFAVVNEVSGEDMTWFFDQVYRSSNRFDYGIESFTSAPEGDGYRTTAVARRYGDAFFPVQMRITLEDGHSYLDQWDYRQDGMGRRFTMTYHTKSRGAVVAIDGISREPRDNAGTGRDRRDRPRVLLLDTNITNNTMTLTPRAGEAAQKWALQWMAWMEDLMLTWGALA